MLSIAYQYRSALVHNNEKAIMKIIIKNGSNAKFLVDIIEYTELLLKSLIENPLLLANIEEKILGLS